MSSKRFTAAVFTILLVVLTPATEALEAWNLRSSSFAIVEGFDSVDARSSLFAIRTEAKDGPGIIAFDAILSDVKVTRVEVVRQLMQTPVLPGSAALLPSNTSTQTFDRARIRLSDTPGGALWFALENSQLSAASAKATIRDTMENPMLRGETYASLPGHPDETHSRPIAGSFLDVRMPDFEATATGRTWLYWLHNTVELWADGNVQYLKSEAWNETVGPIINRHVVYYELEASAETFSLRFVGAGVPTLFMGERITFRNASAISLADGDAELPGSESSPTSSVWLSGRLDATASPAPSGSSDRFTLDVTGNLRSFSLGGAPATDLAPVIAIGGALLFALIAVSVAVSRGILTAAWVPLYTKLRKDKLLNISARDMIYRVIQQAPGIHFLEVQRQVGQVTDTANPIGFGALAYHLSQMERFDLIVSKREGRFRRYFDVSAKMGADAARVALLQTNPVNLVARGVLDAPGVSQGDLHARVNPLHPMSRQALSYHLRRLATKELVVIETRGRFCHYRPTEKLERLSTFVTPGPPPLPPLPPITSLTAA